MNNENDIIIRICKVCGKKFTPKLYHYGKHTIVSDNITCCKKCGYEYAKQKREETNLKKYGCKNPTAYGTKRFSDIMIEKYGVSNAFQSEEIKEKIKQTNLKKYGVEYSLQNKEIKEKSKQTNLKRYGVEYVTQCESIKLKAKQGYLKKYGADHIMHSKSWMSEHCDELQEKRMNTLRKNGTFNTSKPEKQIKMLLEKKFLDVKYQYKSEVYPFHCDFYIPSLDLYIEYQGHWSHGNHVFDSKNKKDIDKLKKWKEKSKMHESYLTAIDVWTNRDPNKRRCAIENDLKYLEFYTINEFMKWYEEL